MPVGRQLLAQPAGQDSVRFSGRLNGGPLQPGRSRLVAVATVAGRHGSASRAPFSVIRYRRRCEARYARA
jgi:hypothetical protein